MKRVSKINEVKSWLESVYQKQKLTNIDPLILKAVQQQTEIGWSQFFVGQITTTWREIIIRRLHENKTEKYNAETWGSGLVLSNSNY